MPGPNKRIVQIAPGVSVEAIEVAIVAQNEQWSTYTLDDGTNLRLKHAVTRVFRVPNQFNGNGDPVYVMQSQPVSVADALPENHGPMPPPSVPGLESA